MFGIGFTELLLIAIVAILFLGPDKLPEAMVQIAKFIKSVQRMIRDTKISLEEEIRIADLKEEALNYKRKLDDVSSELKGFKNIDANPVKEINEAINDAKKSFSGISLEEKDETAIAPLEPKRDTVTFEKNKKENDDKGNA
ncbi:MAG: Sec-independent protein translocase protein TatB [Sulfurovum sp.]|nr:Sec-independent protein translocase protein TatB [Sulfurovum sp.]MDD3602043.1 Sec-independent protein translocase protein TatB [Sulfurovum sp.]